MSEEIEIGGIKIPKTDWDATPPSIQALVMVLSERLSQMERCYTSFEIHAENSSNAPF